ncbi:hypothetical protein CPI83_29435 (plasmid) [Rhodococcus sp. H-CA8f]|uniref:Phage tail tape measure protein n=1 Tax=Rhodococcus qingshengii TaxID=334542 RepID=A0AAW6LQL0_RHOSG|nr:MULTISPECIES: hypothetical protein [Rhodococcus]ATI36326.1 hypothetical protein CPI83_29435 [Rhodococcus sp. H-CA8f]MDE8647541.1 hypothetical protein [Rhodococcus qingshengii]
MTINYNPGQIEAALAAVDGQAREFEDGAARIEAGFKRLADLSEGVAIQAATDTQNKSNALRQETKANVLTLKATAQASLDKVRSQDQQYSGIIA